jgi:hypothetical protein
MSGTAITGLALASLLFTWGVFFGLGEAITSLHASLGQTEWQR